MQDRQPGAPGQYKATLTPAEFQKMQAGEQFTITMVRDDQPIVEGTPYSKAAVLPDDLAAIICPDVLNPSPADAFRALVPRNGKSEMTANLKMGGYKVTGLGKPTSDTDAAPWGMVAPAGFGLGTAQDFTADELDSLTKPGFYSSDNEMTIGGFTSSRWWMEVSAYGPGSTFATQKMHTFYAGKGYALKRSEVNGDWEEWRWVNPPMLEGVEYLTTETSNGNPVYAKRIKYAVSSAFGSTTTTSSMYVPHGTTFTNVVRCVGMRSNYLLPFFGSTGVISVHSVNATSIVVKVDKETIPAKANMFFDFYYTK